MHRDDRNVFAVEQLVDLHHIFDFTTSVCNLVFELQCVFVKRILSRQFLFTSLVKNFWRLGWVLVEHRLDLVGVVDGKVLVLAFFHVEAVKAKRLDCVLRAGLFNLFPVARRQEALGCIAARTTPSVRELVHLSHNGCNVFGVLVVKRIGGIDIHRHDVRARRHLLGNSLVEDAACLDVCQPVANTHLMLKDFSFVWVVCKLFTNALASHIHRCGNLLARQDFIVVVDHPVLAHLRVVIGELRVWCGEDCASLLCAELLNVLSCAVVHLQRLALLVNNLGVLEELLECSRLSLNLAALVEHLVAFDHHATFVFCDDVGECLVRFHWCHVQASCKALIHLGLEERLVACHVGWVDASGFDLVKHDLLHFFARLDEVDIFHALLSALLHLFDESLSLLVDKLTTLLARQLFAFNAKLVNKLLAQCSWRNALEVIGNRDLQLVAVFH